jgi:hypothetical protein
MREHFGGLLSLSEEFVSPVPEIRGGQRAVSGGQRALSCIESPLPMAADRLQLQRVR